LNYADTDHRKGVLASVHSSKHKVLIEWEWINVAVQNRKDNAIWYRSRCILGIKVNSYIYNIK